MSAKTNAARILDRSKIPYRLVEYEVDESDLSAAHLAAQLGEGGGRIFKTLVLRGDKTGYFVCIIPGAAELDMKKAAKAAGSKSCALLPLKDLQAVTGYVRGGCSPLGMKKHFPAFLDASAFTHARIFVSAGQRGLQLEIAPADLAAAARAQTAALTAG